MNEYKIYFNFDHQNHVAQIVKAENPEKALNLIGIEGVHEFVDNRGKLVRVFLNKVTHVEVVDNSRSASRVGF
jgi:hypothetical protein